MTTFDTSLPERVAPASVLEKARRMLRLAEAKTGAQPVGANPEFHSQIPRTASPRPLPSRSPGFGGAATLREREGTREGAGLRECEGARESGKLQEGGGAQGRGGLRGRGEKAVGSLRTDWERLTSAELAQLAGPHFLPGTVAQVSGSLASFWAVAATGMGAEDWAAIAGLPEAGLLAAAQAGVVLSRTVVVPSLGKQPLRVLAGLVDAYGLVMVGGLKLGAGDRRRIEARLRFTGGRLITTGEWGGAKLIVRVGTTHSAPLGEGQGVAGQPRFDLELVCKGSFGAWP